MSLFGGELRRLRRRVGLSQEALAARAGLSTEAVSLLERGRRSPRMTTMRLLADAMGLAERDRLALFSAGSLPEPSAVRLPSYPDVPLGRSAELATLTSLLSRPEIRLVTLLGPGGVGKTRLAVALAAEPPAPYGGAVHWLPLGSVGDAATMLPAMAGALGVRSAPQATLEDVADRLGARPTLIMVDNAEHQLAECAALCSSLLARAPELKVVLTSRHLTGLPEETAYVVPPLPLPPVGASAGELGKAPASRLFLTRAGLLGRLEEDQAAAVVRICRRLDGLPLALELAAARTNVLTLAELADVLETQLDILDGPGPGGGPELTDAVVGWSYSLLDPREQRLFEGLSVFAAGFSRDAVAAVCGEGLTTLELLNALSSLVSKSLVARRDDGSPHARFRLLQLVRSFAAVRLAGRPDAQEVRRRHAMFYRDLVEQTAPGLVGAGQHTALDALDREVGDVRRALSWSLAHDPSTALRMADALSRWCYLRGRYSEGRRWATDALAAAPDAPCPLRARALTTAGLLAFLQCDYRVAEGMLVEARDLYTAGRDESGVAWAIARLGGIARERGRYAEALALHQRALSMFERLGDGHEAAAQISALSFASWLRTAWEDAEYHGRRALAMMRALGDQEGLVWALINLGATAQYRGDAAGADLLLRDALAASEAIAFREGIAWAQNQLGLAARRGGDLARALGWQQASLAEHRALGDRWRMASVNDELAALAAHQERWADSARLLGTADRLRSAIGTPVPKAEVADRRRTEAVTRRALGAAYEAALLTG